MKKLLMSVGVMLCLNANAQWVNKNVNNDFDEPYRICYTETNNSGYLKLENDGGIILFFIKGGYYCEDNPVVDLSFIVNGVVKKYSINATTSESNNIVWLVDDLINSKFIDDFKTCSTLKIRINDSVCETETYSFIMGGSQSAINFITNK